MSLPRNMKQDVKVDIKEGDTIWDLSQKLGVDVGAASGYKSGDPNLIYPGEQLTFKDVSLDKYAQFAEDRLMSQKLGVDVGAASGYKSGDPNLIYPGEQLTFKDVSLDKYAQFAEDRLKSAGMNNPEHSVPDMLKENADAAKKNMEDKVQQSQQQQSQAQSNGKQVPKGAKARCRRGGGERI